MYKFEIDMKMLSNVLIPMVSFNSLMGIMMTFLCLLCPRHIYAPSIRLCVCACVITSVPNLVSMMSSDCMNGFLSNSVEGLAFTGQ